MTLRRTARHAAGLLALTLACFATPTTTGAQRQSAELGWSGTVVVERKASGRISGNGPGSTYIGFDGFQTVTYRLKGDGTATWDGTYTGTIDGGGLYTIPSRGSGSGSGWGEASALAGEPDILEAGQEQADDQEHAVLGAIAAQVHDEPAGPGVNQCDADRVDSGEARAQRRDETPGNQCRRTHDLERGDRAR